MKEERIEPRGILPVAMHHLRRMGIAAKMGGVLKDPRTTRNREWKFGYLLEVLIYGMVSGSKNLRAVETFGELYRHRVPDSTLHDVITRIDPEPLREVLVNGVKEALRAHELPREEFPVRITAIDGKSIGTSRMPVGTFSQEITGDGSGQYRNFALRAFHVSNQTRLLLGQHELPKKSGETSEFIPFIDRLLADYGKTALLEVISIDAGMVSRKNSDYLVSRGLHYIMALKVPQRRLLKQALKLLKRAPLAAQSVESAKGEEVCIKLFRAPCRDSHWRHLKEVWGVEKTITAKGVKSSETRYFLTNLAPSKLSAPQVLAAVRMHWRIENNANWIFDTTWQEDDCPWATRALVFVSHLRMIAFNIVSRLITRRLRDKAARAMSWHELLRCIEHACCKLALCSGFSSPVFEA